MSFPDSVDTWLSHSRPRLELGRGIIAECRVPVQPIIEHLDVLEDVQCRFVARAGLAMVDELTLERAEEAFAQALSQQLPWRHLLAASILSGA